MQFYNKNTNHTVTAEMPWLWAFLFGAFYFMFHGVWTHVAIYAGAVVITGGMAAPFLWIGYSIAAKSVIESHYLSKGYKVVTNLTPSEVDESASSSVG